MNPEEDCNPGLSSNEMNLLNYFKLFNGMSEKLFQCYQPSRRSNVRNSDGTISEWSLFECPSTKIRAIIGKIPRKNVSETVADMTNISILAEPNSQGNENSYVSPRTQHFDNISMLLQIDPNEQVTSTQTRVSGFLKAEDYAYMRSYGIELFSEILSRELINVREGYMDYANEYQFVYGCSMYRGRVIDKIFELASNPQLKMGDKGIIYEAVA